MNFDYIRRARQQGARFAQEGHSLDQITWSDIARAISYHPVADDSMDHLIEHAFVQAFNAQKRRNQ